MDAPLSAHRTTLTPSGITLWWFLLSVAIGLAAMVIFGLLGGELLFPIRRPAKWGGTLFAGMLVFFYMLSVKDKKGFFLVLLVLGMILGLSKTLFFTTSPVFRSTYGFTIPLFFPPLVMLYGIWAFRTVTHQYSSPFSTVACWPFVGLFAMAIISTLLHDRLYGVFDLFELAISFMLFIYAASEIRENRLRTIIIMLIIITLIEAIIAIGQNLTASTLGLEIFGAREHVRGYLGLITLTRVTGTFGHPSNLAEFFDLTLPLTVSMLFYPTKRSLKLLLAIAAVIGFLGLGMTYSRGGIISSVLFSGIVLLIHFCKRLGVARGVFTSMALGVLFSLLILTIPNPIQKGLFRTEYETAYGRLPLMEVAFNMIRANPLFGVGLNNYVPVALNYDFTPQQLTSSWDTAVHNVYLFIAGEIGIPGLGFFLGIVVSVFLAFLPAVRSPDPLIFCSGLGLMAGVAAHLFHWFTDLAPWTTAYLFWLFMGLAVTTGRLAKGLAAASERAGIA
ncbi:MAG: O-antigen ligase family protein [Thermodesulfobacteriota bacterium]